MRASSKSTLNNEKFARVERVKKFEILPTTSPRDR
jgi:hypothetical protein